MEEEKKTEKKFRGIDNAKLIKVIRTISRIGTGTEKNPVRVIYQYWTLDGKLLTAKDAYTDEARVSASSDISS